MKNASFVLLFFYIIFFSCNRKKDVIVIDKCYDFVKNERLNVQELIYYCDTLAENLQSEKLVIGFTSRGNQIDVDVYKKLKDSNFCRTMLRPKLPFFSSFYFDRLTCSITFLKNISLSYYNIYSTTSFKRVNLTYYFNKQDIDSLLLGSKYKAVKAKSDLSLLNKKDSYIFRIDSNWVVFAIHSRVNE